MTELLYFCLTSSLLQLTVTGKGLCLKRQKKSTKIQLQTAGTTVMSFQNKLQILRSNSSAIFITLSLKGYSERGSVMEFGFLLLFLGQYQILPGKGSTADHPWTGSSLQEALSAANHLSAGVFHRYSPVSTATGTARKILGQENAMSAAVAWLACQHLHPDIINRVKN